VDWDVASIFCGYIFVGLFSRILFRLADRKRYVAMHAMQEDAGHDHSTSNGYAEGGSSQRKQQKPQMRDTLAAVGGMLIPLLTQVGHHH
jgi:hypothetical protein